MLLLFNRNYRIKCKKRKFMVSLSNRKHFSSVLITLRKVLKKKLGQSFGVSLLNRPLICKTSTRQ